jgi:CRISPR-associated protein Cmr3
MTIWIMEPRDPLLVRDGRPFGADPGARATSLSFPFPSTIAGGIRARAGLDEQGSFKYTQNNKEELDRLRLLSIRGPLLVQLTSNGEDVTPGQWLLRAPRDALLLPAKSTEPDKQIARIKQLLPLQLPKNVQTDTDKQTLLLVGQQVSDDEQCKPLQGAPSYWYWQAFESWLLNPSTVSSKEQPLSDLGLHGLEREQRMHVSIDAGKEVAKDGMLFETSSLEFTAPGSGKQRLRNAQRLALAVAVDDNDYAIRAGLTGFGGERRIVTWRKSGAELPTPSVQLVQTIISDKYCRLILLTPACFKKGYLPTWLHAETEKYGIEAHIQAIAIDRPQVVSGWDLANKKPKSSKRLAPAGTVFFLALRGSDAAISKWSKSLWMQCISDEEQDRRDGFGLAVLGTWSGQPVAMQKEAGV